MFEKIFFSVSTNHKFNRMSKHLNESHNEMIKKFKEVMPEMSRDVWKCEADMWENGSH